MVGPGNKPAILDRAALHALAASSPPRETFGADGPRPWLAVESAGITPGMAAWLAGLPCPVIGIGAAHPAVDVVVAGAAALAPVARTIETVPIAAMVLVQQLRLAGQLPPEQALVTESLAYATLQHGPEFQSWRARTPPKPMPARHTPASPLRIETDDALHITLARPAERNAIDVAMRDALCEAFDLAAAVDLPVVLQAEGRCFCTGGAVSEFGQAPDPATAHRVRSLRLPAARLLPAAARTTAVVQGAAIGAGAEIAALCGRVVARPDAWFQLPELRYGLIPGAGGTVGIARRIGRQRTAWMAFTMARIPARQALAWGLVDAIEAGGAPGERATMARPTASRW